MNTLLDNIISSEDKTIFTMGDCWVLAEEIRRQDSSWIMAANLDYTHAFCVKQNEKGWFALDVEGCKELNDYLRLRGLESQARRRTKEHLLPYSFHSMDQGYQDWGENGYREPYYYGAVIRAQEITPFLLQEATFVTG